MDRNLIIKGYIPNFNKCLLKEDCEYPIYVDQHGHFAFKVKMPIEAAFEFVKTTSFSELTFLTTKKSDIVYEITSIIEVPSNSSN